MPETVGKMLRKRAKQRTDLHCAFGTRTSVDPADMQVKYHHSCNFKTRLKTPIYFTLNLGTSMSSAAIILRFFQH